MLQPSRQEGAYNIIEKLLIVSDSTLGLHGMIVHTMDESKGHVDLDCRKKAYHHIHFCN